MMASAPLTVIPKSIPAKLRQGKRFTAWRSESHKGQPKPAKMPYSPLAPKGASSTAPGDWVTFEDAVKYAQLAGLSGIMLALVHEDGQAVLDLDHCIAPETGDLAPWAAEIVKRADSYTEITPSGTGLHIFVSGTLPPYGRKRGDVEMYGSVEGQSGPVGRFITMTGHQLPGTPSTVGYRQDFINALHRETFGDAPALTIAPDDPDRQIPALQIGDEDVIRLASESPHNGERFRRLWAGDSSDYAVDGNDGESEGDAALFETLAYYGGPDPERIERLARRSERVREKWDRHKDYLPRSITFAISGKTKFHGDSLQVTPATGSDGASGCACADCPSRARVTFLERSLLDRDDLLEHQQGVITRERARRTALEEYVTGLDGVLARRDLSCTDKVLALVATRELHTRVSKGLYAISRGRLADLAGISPSTVTSSLKRLSTPFPKVGWPADFDPTRWPFKRIVTREVTTDPETGQDVYRSSLDVSPWAETPRETLRTLATFTPAVDRPKHGGSEAATTARWRGCLDHRDAKVIVQGRCAECGEVVGEATVTPIEFGSLIQKEQVALSEFPPPVSVVLKGKQVALSAADDAVAQEMQVASSVAPLPDVRQEMQVASSGPPERCPSPGCRALEFRRHADGAWRCLKSGHDPSAYTTPLAAVVGGASVWGDPPPPPREIPGAFR